MLLFQGKPNLLIVKAVLAQIMDIATVLVLMKNFLIAHICWALFISYKPDTSYLYSVFDFNVAVCNGKTLIVESTHKHETCWIVIVTNVTWLVSVCFIINACMYSMWRKVMLNLFQKNS